MSEDGAGQRDIPGRRNRRTLRQAVRALRHAGKRSVYEPYHCPNRSDSASLQPSRNGDETTSFVPRFGSLAATASRCDRSGCVPLGIPPVPACAWPLRRAALAVLQQRGAMTIPLCIASSLSGAMCGTVPRPSAPSTGPGGSTASRLSPPGTVRSSSDIATGSPGRQPDVVRGVNAHSGDCSHGFRLKPATCSDRSQPGIPMIPAG